MQPRKAICGSTVLLFGLSLFLAAHHHATTLHGYCSDHGERIHLARHAIPHPIATDQPSLKHDLHLTGTHDCAVLAFLAQTYTTVGRPPKSAARPTASPGPDQPHPAVLPDPIPLLLQAPRLPPPVALH